MSGGINLVFLAAEGQRFHVHDSLSWVHLQGSAATQFRWGGKFNSTFVYRNFTITTVKESLKSIHVWQSYARNKKGTIFLTHSVVFFSTDCTIRVMHYVWWWTVSAKECVKNTKRRHKRKAHLSRAADAELAEICLEQQLLREMLLPQQPTEDTVIKDASQSSSLRPNPSVSSRHSSVSCCLVSCSDSANCK